jgi:molybdopterin synthase catalytic subunit
MTIKILKKGKEEISIHQLIKKIKESPKIGECGAIYTFEGIVRGQENNLTTFNLKLETPDFEKTQKELENIIEDIKNKHHVKEIMVVHYIGEFQPGEPLFLVAVAGAHRHEARAALTEVIERVKYELEFKKIEDSNQGNKTIMSGG